MRLGGNVEVDVVPLEVHLVQFELLWAADAEVIWCYEAVETLVFLLMLGDEFDSLLWAYP